MFDIDGYKTRIDNFYETMVQNIDIIDIKLSAEPQPIQAGVEPEVRGSPLEKWTLREMVGHLVDSASFMHQVIIRFQLDENLNFLAYDAESWKNITKIVNYDFMHLINLWKEYNYFQLYLINRIDENNLNKIWERNGNIRTLKTQIEDCFERHLKLHVDLYNERINEIRNTVK